MSIWKFRVPGFRVLYPKSNQSTGDKPSLAGTTNVPVVCNLRRKHEISNLVAWQILQLPWTLRGRIICEKKTTNKVDEADLFHFSLVQTVQFVYSVSRGFNQSNLD